MAIARESVRHELHRRETVVTRVAPVIDGMVRVTVTGPQLVGFSALGPADHVKLFFRADGSDTPVMRDFTPREFREATVAGGDPELDLDFVLHADAGPASSWAASAASGDSLTIGGPRGSQLVPTGMHRLVIVADPTALPAASRWLALTPADLEVTVLVHAQDASAAEYFGADGTARAAIEVLSTPDALETALRALPLADDATFYFLAGEAGSLVPLRRYLRRELALPAEQVSVSGYWRRGVVGLDHHAPLDPDDPEFGQTPGQDRARVSPSRPS